MIKNREQHLIRKIRSLCAQLESEIDAKENGQANQQDTMGTINYKELLEMSADYYWTFDPNANMIQFLYIKGRTSQDMPVSVSYTTILKAIPTDQQKVISDAFLHLLQGESKEEVFQFQRVHGDLTYEMEASCRAFMDGQIKKVMGICKLYNKYSRSQRQTVQEEEKFNVLMSLSNMFIWEYDVKEDTFLANASLFHKLKIDEGTYSFEEAVDLLGMPKLNDLKQHIMDDNLTGHAIVHVKPKGNPMDYIFETNYKPIKDKHGRYQMIIGTMEDITEKEILKTNASKDPLTNSYNRRTADMTLHSSFEKFMNGEDFYTLIFFDIDNFKSINDSYGHDMGDYVLRHVCEVITKEIRNSDMLCRWGGDEFLLICTGISKENIYAYIDRLRKLIDNTEFAFNKEKVHVTVSMGAAYYYHSDVTFDQAMKRADRSVYKSKLAGRNKVCILK